MHCETDIALQLDLQISPKRSYSYVLAKSDSDFCRAFKFCQAIANALPQYDLKKILMGTIVTMCMTKTRAFLNVLFGALNAV